jgi:hypothetical protein
MNRLDFGAIFKRTSSLNSTESKIDSEKVFKRLENNKLESIREGYVPMSYTRLLNEYTDSLSNKNNASDYWYRGLEIIQNLNEHEADRDAKLFTDKYISTILPYVENIGGVLESLDHYNLTDYQYDAIKSVCEQYKLADKIVNNHNQISKRFNIEYEVKSTKLRGIKPVVESCCSMIDTYSYEPYQKLNMCIEEMVYLFEKNNIDYRPDELLSSILEYFLLRSANLSDRDIKGYKYVMENNQCIDDMSPFKFLFEEFECINIKSQINDYLKCKDKTPENTEAAFYAIVMNTSVEDLKNHIDMLLNFLYTVYTSQTTQDCGSENMLKAISKVLNGIVDRYERESMENDTLFRDDIIELIAIFERLKSKINVSDINDPSVAQKIDFKNTLGYIITNRLADLSNSVYSKDNIKALNYVNSDDVEEVALREFKIFKFNNIVKATINLDKYLKTKIRNFINKSRAKSKVKMKKVKNILFDESGRYIPESIYNFIGDDNKVDICLCQIELESEEEISEALDELSSICKEFNNELNINRIDGVKSYYLINGCIAEIHLKDCTKLILTEEETAMVNSAEKPELDIYIEQLALFEACNSIAEDFDDKTLDEKIASIFIKETDLSLEAYDVIMDIFSLIGANKNQVDMFTESFSDYRNKIIIESADAIAENKFIKSIYNNWEPMENVPYDIQVEAYSIFNDIIQEAAPKVNKPKVGGAAVKNSPIVKKVGGAVNKAKEKNNDYNPSENISNKLNNIKIYLQGLKSKAKGLSQKEKELSRQLDANYNNFAKAVKNAFISDRRESIIKGSVIPSFSKSIKIAIALAGLGIVTGNPIIPIAAALGGLAVSKKLTKRERILLLDEIETELEVVEKEIANADARNQIKKYRALLQYKKNLQRQYQRIKYNVRVGKDILPGSAAGFKERN